MYGVISPNLKKICLAIYWEKVDNDLRWIRGLEVERFCEEGSSAICPANSSP
jgi:hypothetical protein